jgi:hypothetical protein
MDVSTSSSANEWIQFLSPLMTLVLAAGWAYVEKIKANKATQTLALAQDTNNLVNGQHGRVLETVAVQAQQIAALTGNPVDAQKAVDAERAVTDHGTAVAASEPKP